MMPSPYRHIIGPRVAAALARDPAPPSSSARASGGTIITDIPSLVEHEFAAGDTFSLFLPGLLPVDLTITGTASFGGITSSGATNVVGDVAVTVTSGSLTVSYDPTEFERGHPLGYGAWFIDAGDTTTITETGGAVSQINDLGANGNHATQGTGSAQPTTGTRSHNGLNVLDFDGTSDWMQAPAFDIDVSGRAVTIFAVLKWDASGTGRNALGALRSGQVTSLNSFMLEYNGGNHQVVYGNGASGFANGNFRERRFSFPGTTDFHKYIITIDTTVGPRVWIDDVEQTLTNGNGSMPVGNFLASDSTDWSPYFGRRPDPFYFDGAIGTYGIISTVLDATERAALSAWIFGRWAL